MKQTRPCALLVVVLLAAFFSCAASRAETPSFTVGWSVYAGWNPYFYMQKSGIPEEVGRQVRRHHQGAAV